MKVTEVESIVLMGRYHFVRVRTDEGLDGVGEVSPMNASVTHTMVEKALAPLVVGQDPFDVELIWHRMFHRPYKLGPTGAQLEAMAGIDIALWDVIGKASGQPVYKLIGGAFRKDAEVYASSMRRDMSPREEAERALSFKEQGYRAYKIHSATPWMYDNGFDQTLDTVREMRKLVGDDFAILVDVNNAYLPHTAIKMARKLEEYDVWRFEEPVPAYDYAGLAQVADAVDIPIAAGEQEYQRWQFRDLILTGKVDILQADVIKCGGITELRKVANLADAYYVTYCPHEYNGPVTLLAGAHVGTATPNLLMCEYHSQLKGVLEEVMVGGYRYDPQFIDVPDAPGLGVQFTEAFIREHRIDPTTWGGGRAVRTT